MSMEARQFPGMNPSARMGGLIATLRRGDETTVRQFLGSQRDALRACAACCDAEGWRIVTLSNPATIFRDLQGTRVAPMYRKGTQRFGEGGEFLQLPEHRLLGTIGRSDLLAEARRG